MTVRQMTASDAGWAAALMEQRRLEYERYSPVFWRPARNITPHHAQFLEALIADPNAIALRNDDGFAIATNTGGHFYVDDFAVGDGTWPTTGADLLLEVWRAASTRGSEFLRVVTAELDVPKVALLTAHSLNLSQQWWVRSVEAPASEATRDSAGDEPEDEFELHETEAPPVYDPGGPVGILASFTSGALDRALGAAADRGLVLVVAPTPPGDEREAALQTAGFTVASQFYLGKPVSLSWRSRSG